ncbi:transcription factor [Scheffersomyces coipomensis]|uniref:transcription factor n=1 Tax=Scheffersomyces coipomensis TaxID=1788519 RepID=UPI00315D6CDE
MPKIAEEHSMDIPHVTAVELPLIVKDSEKAIAMIGGRSRVSEVINSINKGSNLNSHTTLENTLELRLRNDPFHHPVQSSYNTSEKILLKISIPKKSLPKDYYDNPNKYSTKELISINAQDKSTPTYRAQPIAIIDKTYSFKSIADFQISTKNNPMVQDFNQSILDSKNFSTLKQYFDKHNNFNSISDYKDTANFKNNDHQLPPPPILSPIRFPFDYKYQKNPFTTAVKDAESGEIRVVSTKNSIKLYTKMIDYHTNDVPDKPAPELIENYTQLTSKNYPVTSPEYLLLACINWVKEVFDLKPIWLRKQLEDIVPDNLKRFIKQALPYVTFIYKSGPWRFCNVKFGVDPKSDKSFWIYQSEYFRIPNLKFIFPKENSRRIVPNTIIEANRKNKNSSNKEIEVSEYLFFNGVTLPATVTYQIGDILDLDITTIIENHRKYFGRDFLREVPDFQDGWFNRQTMEVVRRIVRYKLNRIVKEEATDQNKIYKIINTDYTSNEDQTMEVDEENGKEVAPNAETEVDAGNDEEEEDDDVDVGVDEEAINEDATIIDEANIMNKLDLLSEDASSKLSQLIGFIKQDDIED